MNSLMPFSVNRSSKLIDLPRRNGYSFEFEIGWTIVSGIKIKSNIESEFT